MATVCKNMQKVFLFRDIPTSMKMEGNYCRHECNGCNYVWYSKKESPKNYNNKKYNFPYWNKMRIR